MFINIVTICYNNIIGLKSTHESIIFQSYKSFNWIVIDGGSTDGTVDYVNAIINKKGINVIFKSESDLGVYDAMNKGLNKSNGDYVIFLNAGDSFCSNDVLKNVVSKIDNNFALIYGHFYRELKTGDLTLVKAKPLKYIYHSLPTSHQAIFYNLKKLNGLVYDLDYKICSDYYFTSKLVMKLNLISLKDYLVLDLPISIFEYNGLSRNNLSRLYTEAFQIQRDILKVNIFFRFASYYFRFLRNKLL